MKVYDDIQEGMVLSSAKYGKFTILEVNGCKNVVIKFHEPSYTYTTTVSNIRMSKLRNPYFPSVLGIGFTGVGVHKTYNPVKVGKTTTSAEYHLWSNMLYRAYDKKCHTRYPTYIGCSVNKRWHNFQNFCEDIKHLQGYTTWYLQKQLGVKGCLQLDKDIKVPGNREYGPNTCMFVTAGENIRGKLESSQNAL